MANTTAIREAAATALSGIPGTQVSATVLADPSPPSIFVTRGPVEYHKAMGNGHHDRILLVQAFVALNDDIGAEELLDRYTADTGDYSIKAALEDDRTLGGTVDSLIVQSCSEPRVHPRPDGSQLLWSEWRVLVLAPGD